MSETQAGAGSAVAVATRSTLGSSSVTVTRLGLGGATLGNLYAKVDDEVAEATVKAALEVGIRFFDTAPYYGYGLAEGRLGRGLARSERSDLTVSTKVGRLLKPRPGSPRVDQGFIDALPFDPTFDYSYGGVMRSFEESLVRLGRSHVDVLLLHDVGALTHGSEAHPSVFDAAMEGGYRALAELRSAGTIGAVGLGVNECAVCLEAMERADFDCFLLAGRYTLLEQGAVQALLPACLERNISVIVGGPYNSGILVEEEGARAHYDYAEAPVELITRVRRIREICDAHHVPIAAAALQFPLLHPAVACVIPGARNPAEVRANAGWFAHLIPDGLWSDLASADLLDPQAPTSAARSPE